MSMGRAATQRGGVFVARIEQLRAFGVLPALIVEVSPDPSRTGHKPRGAAFGKQTPALRRGCVGLVSDHCLPGLSCFCASCAAWMAINAR